MSIRLTVGETPPYLAGSFAPRYELKTARNLLDKIGRSDFSVVAFGEYLFEAARTEEELEKTLLTSLYFIANLTKFDDRPVGYVSRRIMDSLEHYGYLEGLPPEQMY